MSSARDAAILYFALNGTDRPLTCRHFGDEDEPCRKTLAGISLDDGAPLCAEHTREECGQMLSEDTLAELWIIKRTLDAMRARRVPESNLEAFALQVAGVSVETNDTIPAPPPSGPRTLGYSKKL